MTVAEPPRREAAAPALLAKYGDRIAPQEGLDQPTWVVRREVLADLARDLRDHPEARFDLLLDLCGADYPARAADGPAKDGTERFEAVYHLCSLPRKERLRLKVPLPEADPVLPSLIPVWQAADWFEREAFDMYGIVFSNHPDLRRLLTDYGFQGFPLRKDFPLTGHVEVRYDAEQQRVIYEPVKLTQRYRNFDFLSPWEGMTLPGDEKAGEGKP